MMFTGRAAGAVRSTQERQRADPVRVPAAALALPKRSAKMGAIVLPWGDDRAACSACQSAILRGITVSYFPPFQRRASLRQSG
jgi:hypothetical protein